MSLEKSIDRLKKVITDKNCKKMNLSNVKGYLGELMVFDKLTKEGLSLEQKGNQSGYDIGVLGTGIKIDVKLSTVKTEIKGCPPYWGWALKHENKKRGLSATHFVCVALNDDFSVKEYYIIQAADYKKFPKSAIGQFGKVENGFTILKNERSIKDILDDKLKVYFQTCSALVDKGVAVRLSGNKKLASYLD
jgi:hypothetical protein